MTGSDGDGELEIATSCGGEWLSQAPASVRVDVVDDGEVRRFRAVGDLDADGGAAGIAGETDMAFGLPGQGRDLDRSARNLDAGARTGRELAAGEQGDDGQRNHRGQNLETQHDTTHSAQARDRGLMVGRG